MIFLDVDGSRDRAAVALLAVGAALVKLSWFPSQNPWQLILTMLTAGRISVVFVRVNPGIECHHSGARSHSEPL